MAGIALVAAQVDRPLGIDREVGVDLDLRLRIALVVVVPGPRLVPDEGEGEILVGRQIDVARGARPALGDGGVHHRLQPILRDNVVRPELRHPLGQRTGAGQQGVDLGQHRVEAGERRQLRPHPEQGLGLVGEAHALARQHAQPRRRRRDVGQQVLLPLRRGRIRAGRRDRLQPVGQRRRALDQLGDGARVGLGRRRPLGGTVIGVDIALLVLADLEDQAHVVARDSVEAVAAGTARSRRRRGAGAEQGRQADQECAHRNPPILQIRRRASGSPDAFGIEGGALLL